VSIIPLPRHPDRTTTPGLHWGLGPRRAICPTGPPGVAPLHGYGDHASPRAFGHGGRTSSVAFADPAHDLAAAVYWNGAADHPTHTQRLPSLLNALYLDLELAS
jgi:CubicO group peptidase (beta-lactamase class C family)